MRYSGEKQWADAAMVLALLVLGILLTLLGAGLMAQWQESAARHQDSSVEAILAAVATAAGTGLLLWWVLSFLGAGASVLLDRVGRRRAASAARRLSPAFMQRAVVAALSIQLVTGAAANAVMPAPGPEWTPTQGHSSSAPSFPATPDDAPTPYATETRRGMQVPRQLVPAEEPSASRVGPSPAWSPTTQPSATALNPGWQPAGLVVEPGLLAAPGTRAMAGPQQVTPAKGSQAGAVTVLAGDTLWDIVSAHLGPEASDVDIALEWPRWYAANRELIGGSPDVLLPGQILQAPTAP
ncbi:LysM peptidoglycan-binding domain-containing protein [Arthrobacter liuii]|uniref:LysM domain-containing protein n=1 Tax=Arthrobacter liuii TaxID=1476996 RepID=A0ABQ2AU81_9MICC|nr:hypothetical protein [Arthrobacter liuii]GGH97746.1 hypothetical protein GCM10007170_28700 [Arthrobacter liuii]